MKANFFKILGTVAWLATAFGAAGCTITDEKTYEIKVSPVTHDILETFGSSLRHADAEMDVRCRVPWHLFGDSSPECTVKIEGGRSNGTLEAEVLNRPFDGTPMVLRVHGGTQALQRALNEALASYSPARDFQYRGQGPVLDERKLELEGGKIKFRCVATQEASPTFECWTLVSASLLK